MDRRLFVTGLLGVAGTAGIATLLPRHAEALASVPLGEPAPQSQAYFPELPKLPESSGPLGEVDDQWEPGEEWESDEEWEPEEGGFQLANHMHRHRRRRVRRWRRVCRRWWHNGHWHRRCRRRPYWFWFWFWA